MTLEELLALLPDNNTGAIDAADLRTIVTELYTRDDTNAAAADGRLDALEAGTAALDGRLDQAEANITTLQSDLNALEATVAINSDRLDDLELAGDGYAQVFSYLWVTTANPAAGKVTVNAWSMSASLLQISETTDDGQNLTFAVMDGASRAQITIHTADGKRLRADVNGPTSDQGSYRNVSITPTEVSGTAPATSQKTTVAIIVWP